MALDRQMVRDTLNRFTQAYAESRSAGAELTDFDIRRIMFHFLCEMEKGYTRISVHVPARLVKSYAIVQRVWCKAVAELMEILRANNVMYQQLQRAHRQGHWKIDGISTGRACRIRISTDLANRCQLRVYSGHPIVEAFLDERTANVQCDDDLTAFDVEQMLYRVYMQFGYPSRRLQFDIPQRNMRYPLLWNWRAKVVWEEVLIQDETIRSLIDPSGSHEGKRMLCQARGNARNDLPPGDVDGVHGITLMFTNPSDECWEKEFDPEVWPLHGVPSGIPLLL